jgi:hypothetical protein
VALVQYVQIGDGKVTPFWEAKWLHRAAPLDLAPNLFKTTIYKNITVHCELRNNNWIRSLQNINTPAQLDEFVLLFLAISSVNLSNSRDEITWKWTPNGEFSVASAYDCQFHGSMTLFLAAQVWQAKTQPKCKFFAWMILHNRALTTDNMLQKNWPCNPTCHLCFCQPETSCHLLTQCNYAEAFWNCIAPQYDLPPFISISSSGGLVDWVIWLSKAGSSSTIRSRLGVLFSFWWHLWKERNMRIF